MLKIPAFGRKLMAGSPLSWLHYPWCDLDLPVYQETL